MSKLPGETVSYGDFLERAFGTNPRSVLIEVADRCNETCIHCYQVQGLKGEMSTEEIFAILEDLADAGVMFLTLSGGEATLRHDLLDIIRRARELQFVVDLFTNGLRMTRALAEQLAELEVRRVEISLYSMKAEVHDWVTRVPGSFEKTLAGIRHLVDLGVEVKVKKSLMAPSASEELQFDAWVESLGAIPMVSQDLKPREDGDRTPESLLGPDDARASLERRGFLGRPGQPIPPLRSEDPVCGACAGIYIESAGEMRPCTMLDVAVGDARKGNIVRQLNEHPEAEFLRTVQWRDLPGCSTCDLNSLCARCHAHALHQVGDALRPYPTACSQAVMRWEAIRDRASGADWRSPTLIGPFREVDDALVSYPASEDERQAQLYRAHEWLRAEGSAHPGPHVSSGQLVQIRRPGRAAKPERIPDRVECAPPPSSE